ncbi:iron complex outermembrane receptor protein [Dyadobacter jejuensis]|uniref:Iron complex outermembrane receptor protein n=1 Tax=Dyadobacter jejuensis TaxID=1082580 RepID=A0A316ALT5_9BACT|nr:TonB-dependent receptor [Dyadobacter jejuensis]PWJ58492.1 iron complex outermembrane receptor protein [Dyadobacter jejuensis]
MAHSFLTQITPLLLFVLLSNRSFAQTDTLATTHHLEEVKVQAFASSSSPLQTTATVGILTSKTFLRLPANTWVAAVNTVPGVRMEERSPGSYRFSIRGSLIRSPFGVRNVKFYWNGIPFTDASGNTAINSLDYGAINHMEIIKGPGSSLYGAGTGGVVLLQSEPSGTDNHLSQSLQFGRYGYLNNSTEIQLGATTIQYGHTQQEGYRSQSAMTRDALRINSSFDVGQKGRLSILGMYSDLHYQTPGGINLTQYQTDPTLARQATATIPGSESQKAGIYSKVALLGFNYRLSLGKQWTQSSALYLSTTDFTNPFITNYEKRNEVGIGGRNLWQYRRAIGNVELAWTSGFEWQYGKSAQKNFDNEAGTPTQIQTAEDIGSKNLSVFTQLETVLGHGLTLNTGLSYNYNQYLYEKFHPLPYANEQKTIKGIFAPRVALNKVIDRQWSATLSYSEGFSAPTLQEIRPSAGGFRADLNAEKGSNFELSLRREGKKLSAEVNAYHFALKETIVSRSDSTGSEFFVNAGNTRQNGIEWRVSYSLFEGKSVHLQLWTSGNGTHYTFRDYSLGESSYHGNRLPGVPALTLTSGLNASLPFGFAVFATHQHGGKVYLNDANTVESTPYDQWIAKLTWKKEWGRHLSTEWSASVEKVYADIYSLGYDYNAFGSRYYNSAPKNNFWTGLKLGWRWSKK